MKAILYYDALKKIVNATKDFISKDDNVKPSLGYVRVDFEAGICSATAVALDGYRLSKECAECIGVDEDFSIYVKPMLPKGKPGDQVIIEVKENVAYINVDGLITGFRQPNASEFNYKDVIPKDEPTFKIAFNSRYLLDAIKASSVSRGGFTTPTILEFRGDKSPILIKTGESNVRMVLPIRMKEGGQG